MAGPGDCDCEEAVCTPIPPLLSGTLNAGTISWPSQRSAYQAASPVINLKVREPAAPAVGPRQFLYMLHVERQNLNNFGNPLIEAVALNLANLYGLYVVIPETTIDPWWADNASTPTIRQESYLNDVVVPTVEQLIPETDEHPGDARRVLVGYSKSGYGALSLMLRRPELWEAAALWDAPVGMQNYDGSDPGLGGFAHAAATYGTQQNFDDNYKLTSMLAARAAPFTTSKRIYMESNSNPVSSIPTNAAMMLAMHNQMTSLGMLHDFVAGPNRTHNWAGGGAGGQWLPTAAAWLADYLANNPPPS